MMMQEEEPKTDQNINKDFDIDELDAFLYSDTSSIQYMQNKNMEKNHKTNGNHSLNSLDDVELDLFMPENKIVNLDSDANSQDCKIKKSDTDNEDDDFDLDSYFQADKEDPTSTDLEHGSIETESEKPQEPKQEETSQFASYWAWGLSRFKEESEKIQQNPNVQEFLNNPNVIQARETASASYRNIREKASEMYEKSKPVIDDMYEKSKPVIDDMYQSAQPTLSELKTASMEIRSSMPTMEELKEATREIKDNLPTMEELAEGVQQMKASYEPLIDEMSRMTQGNRSNSVNIPEASVSVHKEDSSGGFEI